MLVKVWENLKKLWKHSPAAHVPTAFDMVYIVNHVKVKLNAKGITFHLFAFSGEKYRVLPRQYELMDGICRY